MAKPCKKSSAAQALTKLKARLPTAFPVRMGKPLPKHDEADAAAYFTGKSYILRVKPNLTFKEATDAVIHEYAHFRVWGRLQALTYEHDAHWGIEFALCYTEWKESG